MLKIYGIKNCDTLKKTLKWFDAHQVDYEFVDYKKTPPTENLLKSFLKDHPWDVIINKRGTTWRKLDDGTKTDMDDEKAIPLMLDQPSIVKRPIIENEGQFYIGYDEKQFETLI